MTRWRWRGSVAMLAVAVGFVIYPLIEGSNDVINSDWPAFASGARILVTDPGHLYDFDVQRRVELEVTGGRTLITLGINGILPFVAPAWVAFFAVPFELLGTDFGGRLWILFGLACLAIGLYLAVRPRAPAALLPAFASVADSPPAAQCTARRHGCPRDRCGDLALIAKVPGGTLPRLTLLKPQLDVAARRGADRAPAVASVSRMGDGRRCADRGCRPLEPQWVFQWLPALNGPVRAGSREVDLAHFGTLLPSGAQAFAVAGLTVITIAAVVLLARSQRGDFRAAVAVLVAGGVIAAPHALPTDLVLVALALAIWCKAQWYDWLLLSVGAAIAAFMPAPVPAVTGVIVVGWVCLRAAGLLTWSRREPAPMSTG